jgi:hypothetical protein
MKVSLREAIAFATACYVRRMRMVSIAVVGWMITGCSAPATAPASPKPQHTAAAEQSGGSGPAECRPVTGKPGEWYSSPAAKAIGDACGGKLEGQAMLQLSEAGCEAEVTIEFASGQDEIEARHLRRSSGYALISHDEAIALCKDPGVKLIASKPVLKPS